MLGGPRTVTVLLRAWRAGDPGAFEELMPRVYDELRGLAQVFLYGDRPEHTFQATDLVSEAYLRLLAAGESHEWSDRVHFFCIAARAMRQILVDHARRRSAVKRNHGERPVALDDNLVAIDRPEDLLLLDDALRALAEHDERKARAVELHYFGGMSLAEVAEVLDVHVNTVNRDLRFAVTWLHARMQA
jgi:RNA polymerase sigma factor (TIGR02999 family)